MTTITATNARNNWFELIKKTIKSHIPVNITSKEGNAVLLSQEDYDSLIETLELCSDPGFVKSVKKADQEIKDGKTYSMDDVFGSD